MDQTNFPSDEGIRKLADKNSNKGWDQRSKHKLIDWLYLALKWSFDPGKAISNKNRVVEYYADFLIYSLSIPMYVAVLLFVYYLWEADAKEEEKGPSSYKLCALRYLICGISSKSKIFIKIYTSHYTNWRYWDLDNTKFLAV